MRKHDEIMDELATLRFKLGNLERLASDKAVKLEQALNCAEHQRDSFLKQRDALLEERDVLRTENERLRSELHALDGRLRHLLQSKTIQLLDESDGKGGYKYDIKTLDALSSFFQCSTCEHYENLVVGLAPCRTCRDYSNWEPKV